ncbi:hypothetical protein RND71_004979 [Anisodus tanguticus]|uniref:Syringolide-induced protein 14-1-1 n=1 Tax=Anisodus tanguticus TaxID=243964 RepID=A0AAE1VM61_9SOLA|nr:hypothetical protein RND71_004979 [Anisodus tanguticus]
MEKTCKSSKKKTIFKLLPKAAAAAAFILHNAHAPFSPSREKRLAAEHQHKNHHHKGFAGPIIPVIPAHQSGRKSEPSSPKISCIGQIKHNKKKLNRISSSKTTSNSNNQQKNVTKKSVSNFGNMFGGKSKLISGRKSDVAAENIICKLPDRAPCLSQMQRFASGREPLTNFDWRSIQITTEDHHKYYTDDDRGHSDDEDEDEDEEEYDEDEEEELNVTFSAPILEGRGRTNIYLEPRKEINLWKRRTMNQPIPLQLNNY